MELDPVTPSDVLAQCVFGLHAVSHQTPPNCNQPTVAFTATLKPGMGDSEIYCQLCGVSSNIARIRTKDESPLQSWNGRGVMANDQLCTSYVGQNIYDPEECSCLHDECRFKSTYLSCRGCLFTCCPSFPDLTMEAGWDDEEKRGTADWPEETFWPYNRDDAERKSVADMFDDRSEHIAGPNCHSSDGYNGHNITAEEMRLCGTMQCLVPKELDWEPELGDEEFETAPDSQYFLSGLCDFLATRRTAQKPFEPPRHGMDDPWPENYTPHSDWAADLSMPFHPACFEVYKRACIARKGRVDVRALTDWFRLDANEYMAWVAEGFPRDDAARGGHAQYWRHNNGDEWLAANPLFVPKLESVFAQFNGAEGAKITDDFCSNVISMNEPLVTQDRRWAQLDNFERLSMEIRDQVLSYLGGKEIANLRLVSRAFRVLPQSLFRRLVLEEHPWFWEAWCDRPYPIWAATTCRELERQRKISRPERAPGQSEAAFEKERKQCQMRFDEFLQPRPANNLPSLGTNWLRVYTVLNRNLTSWLGLRNRKRIWDDCNFILDRIEMHTRKGRMGNGINVDAVARHVAWKNDELSDSDMGIEDNS